MVDQRRCHRLKLELPASLSNSSWAMTFDLSAIGLCLMSKEKIKVGETLLISVALPSGENIKIPVQAIWVREHKTSGLPQYKVGLKILEPLTSDESKFIKFYAKHLLECFRQPS